MIKKMINKKPPRLSSPRPNKNLYFSPLPSGHKNSTRKLKPQTPSSLNIKQSNFSTSNNTNANTNSNNRGVVSSITDYSQSFMRLASDLIKDNNSNNMNYNSNCNEKNVTTIESLHDLIMNSDNEESNNTNSNNGKKMISLTKIRKKDCKNMNLSISAMHNSLLTPGKQINISRSSNSNQLSPLPQVKLNNEFNIENNKWFNVLLRKSEFYEEFDFKLRNYTKIKNIIQKEIDLLLSQNTISSYNNTNTNKHNITHINSIDITKPQFQTQSNIIINNTSLKPLMLKNINTPTHINLVLNDHPNYFSERPAPTVIKLAYSNTNTNTNTNPRRYNYNNIPDKYYNSRNSNDNNLKKVNDITSEIYENIFTKIFNDICVMPNYIDRNYIKFSKLNYINLCFVKPLFDVLFKCMLSINKGQFLRFCGLIYKELTPEEKKKFIYDNKMRKN
jgi:hypothetical protein